MSKAILLSIKPELVAKILNGEKTIEVRKKFPADYKGWVYIYVTKGKPLCYRWDCSQDYIFPTSREEKAMWTTINGKVVARFWCDKVEEINRQGWVSKYPYNAAKTDAHKEGGLKCPYCGSTETIYVDTKQEADPADSDDKTGTQYVETHNYKCNNCSCEFYTYTETTVLHGTGISKYGVADDEDAGIYINDKFRMYGDAYDFYYGRKYNHWRTEEEYFNPKYWKPGTTRQEMEEEAYEFNGWWIYGPALEYWTLKDFKNKGKEKDFVELSNKIGELDIDTDNDYGAHKDAGTLYGTRKNLIEFIQWAKSHGFKPFSDGEKGWRWEDWEDIEDEED